MVDIRDQLLAAFELEHREHVDAIRAGLVRLRAGEVVDLREVFRRAHSLKGAARAVDQPQIERDAHALETIFADAQGGGGLNEKQIADALSGLDSIERVAATLYAPSAVAGDAEPAHTKEFLRVDAEQMQRLSASMHDLSGDLDAVESASDALSALHRQATALGRAIEQIDTAVRLRPEAASSVVAQVSEQSRALSRALALVSREQGEIAWSLSQAADRVRDDLARIAMTPASSVFAGLGPMIRTLAEEAGKEVEVLVDGLDVQADRALLQTLRDPVIHLLRNALAHGIEQPDERERRGKTRRGVVGLTVAARAGRLVVTVFDDGRGPDFVRLESTAIARGLLVRQPEEQGPVAPERLLALAFEPGLSTADEVGPVAGRGMGLSVVAEAARRAGGGAAMRARALAGTEVTISAPLSAVRQTILVMDVAGEAFAVPTYALERVVNVKADSLEVVGGRLAFRVAVDGNQTLVPIVNLDRITGARSEIVGPEAGRSVAIAVLKLNDQRIGLQADSADAVRAANVISLDGADVSELVLGAVQLDRGALVTVLNPDAILLHFARGMPDARVLAPTRPTVAAPARPQTVLVVDDSVTTRTLEKSILEAQGYRVLLSVDGVDALNVLRRDGGLVDVIVADIEMPRMDGFQLLQALKQDPAFASLPVILMTSRSDPEDVRRGLELGADAYLVKQSFDQSDLLSTIRQLL